MIIQQYKANYKRARDRLVLLIQKMEKRNVGAGDGG